MGRPKIRNPQPKYRAQEALKGLGQCGHRHTQQDYRELLKIEKQLHK